jgi:5-methylthioadenosine/S-adenosylhomocysteine deaminase
MPRPDVAPRTVFRADWVLPGAGAAPIADGAVAVDPGGRVSAVGPTWDVVMEGGPVEDLGPAILMPGMVNAHQHGRGISQLLMGYPDMQLEPWIAGRRRHGPPDIYAVTRLAAEAMLAHGVTATLHANYTYGSGDYEAELRAQIEAYRDAGLRATICIGLQDRGGLLYPDVAENEAVARFPAAAREALGVPSRPAWMADFEAAADLMTRLARDYAGAALIGFAWGPAGPQWVSDETWSKVAADAAARGVGIHFHLLESPAQAATARRLYPDGTLARLRALGVLAGPTSCAHAVHLTDEDRAIAAGEGLMAVLNPGSNMRLFNGTPDVAALAAAGVALAVGTDNCALDDTEDLLSELRLAMALGRVEAPRSGPEPRAITLAAVTEVASRAAFLDPASGTLSPGAPADLCAFPLEGIVGGCPVDPGRLEDMVLARCKGGDCVLTVVAGKVRFRADESDRARHKAWRAKAEASVEARTNLLSAEQTAAIQAALEAHYRGRP